MSATENWLTVGCWFAQNRSDPPNSWVSHSLIIQYNKHVEKHFLRLLFSNDLFDCFDPRRFFPPRLSRFIDDLKLDRRTQRDDGAEMKASWRNAAPAPVICHVCWRNLLLHPQSDYMVLPTTHSQTRRLRSCYRAVSSSWFNVHARSEGQRVQNVSSVPRSWWRTDVNSFLLVCVFLALLTL